MICRSRHLRLMVLLLVLLTVSLCTLASAEKIVTDMSADRLIDRTVDGETIRYLIGHVLIVRDSMTVAADSALFYTNVDEYDFFGHVRMTRGDAVLTCRSAFYNERSGDADFQGDVRIIDQDMIGTGERAEMRDDGNVMRLIRNARVVSPDYVVHADTVVTFDDSELGEAFGHVVMVDPGGESLVTGGHATFDRDGGRMVVDRDPKLENRERGDEPLLANARLMDFLRDEDRIVMTDSVRIRQGRMYATGDTAVIRGQEHMRLTGSPSMDDGEGTVFRAQIIETWYEDGELVRTRLEGDAAMEDIAPAELADQYAGLPASNTLSGDTITVQMKDGAPHRSLVTGNAHSVYVPVDAAKEVAFNDVSGDTILIAFENRRVNQVDVRSGMKGTYSFLRLEALNELAAAATAMLDSLLSERDESIASALPDTLVESLPEHLDDWRNLDPALGALLASTLVESLQARGDSALVLTVERALKAALADTLADGTQSVDFTANREFVDYSGNLGLFMLGDKRIILRGNANLVYGSIDLTAQDIRLETQDRELYASGTPMFVDGGEKIAGRKMAYDFGNRSAAVQDGVTAMDDYYYVGNSIKRFGDGELKIRGGKMTSCDLDRPHYHFAADKMKIQMGDKVVAKPIILKVGEVPLFALPFYFKSLETGRRSGIIFPTFDFGWSSRTGRYIRNWGYYWATNDYTDFTFQGDYNERREFTWQLSNRYVTRYGPKGDIRYSRRTTLSGDPQTREWQFKWNHNQPTLFDEYRFRADVKMSSKTIERSDLLNDVGAEVINGQQTSNVSISRSWTNVSTALSFKRDEYVNAADDDVTSNKRLATQHFPKGSLSFTSKPLAPSLRAGQKGSLLGNILRNTYFRHSYSGGTTETEYETTRNRVDQAAGNLSLDIKPPKISIFSVTTGASTGFNWKRDETTGQIVQLIDGSEETVSATELVEETSKSLSVNTSVSTTLYGLFGPKIGSLRGMRHTMRFSASHRWRPEIEGAQSADQNVSFRLGNRFDLKFLDADSDSVEAYRKLDGVLDWSLSTSYDPDKVVEQRWSNVNSTMTIKPGQNRNLKLTVNSVIDPYEMMVTSTRFSYGLNFSGKFDTGGKVIVEEQKKNQAIDMLATDGDTLMTAPVIEEDGWIDEDDPNGLSDDVDDFGGYGMFADKDGSKGQDDTDGGRFIPWRMGSSISYSKNHLTDTVSARASLNAALTLTRTWDVSWRGSYDFESGALTSQSYNLERDLHCWSLRFTRTLSRVDSQFGFMIALKAIPDLKVTRGRSDLVGGGISGISRKLQ
jgi:lipopolysaccharide assembly outer membrane protein LptD (OstA)